MYFSQLMLIFCYVSKVNGVQFRVDGLVKLGPKLQYDLQIRQPDEETRNFELQTKLSEHAVYPKALDNDSPIRFSETNEQPKHNDQIFNIVRAKNSRDPGSAHINITLVIDDYINKTDHQKNPMPLVTREDVKQRAQVQTPHRIKDDADIQKYIVHVYNQALTLFDNMQERLEDKVSKHNFHKLKHLYQERIEEYIVNMGNQTLRTKLGAQKAILNTLTMSNRIVKKLLDNMNVFTKGSLRNDNKSMIFMQKELENELSTEYSHICKQYNICRSKKSFSDLLVDILSMIIKTDDAKVKQSSDALTEVMRDMSFVKIMDWESHKNFRSLVRNFESTEAVETRIAFLILKNVIANRNQPIPIYGAEDMALVNKTVAFQDIINEFDKAIPGNNKNLRDWDNLLFRLDRWVNLNEYRSSILDIWSHLFKIIKIGIDSMTEYVAQTVRKNLRLILV